MSHEDTRTTPLPSSYAEKIKSYINSVPANLKNHAQKLLADILADIYALNAELLPCVEGKRSPRDNNRNAVHKIIVSLKEHHQRLSHLIDLSTPLDDLLHEFIDIETHVFDLKKVKALVQSKDDELAILESTLINYLHEQFTLFISEDSKKEQDKQASPHVEEILTDDVDLLNDLKEQIENFAKALENKNLTESAATEYRDNIRHAARGLDNSYNEIGATILGTTAIPLHGALHEYLGSLDAVITARDGDRLERGLKWMNKHLNVIQGFQQQFEQTLRPTISPHPKP